MEDKAAHSLPSHIFFWSKQCVNSLTMCVLWLGEKINQHLNFLAEFAPQESKLNPNLLTCLALVRLSRVLGFLIVAYRLLFLPIVLITVLTSFRHSSLEQKKMSTIYNKSIWTSIQKCCTT